MKVEKIIALINRHDKILMGIGKNAYPKHKLPELYTNWDQIKKYNIENKSNLDFNTKLYSLLKNKDYFVITTSWESQLSEVIPSENLYTPNGNSKKLQCYNACSLNLWDFSEFLNYSDIPTCPFCSSSLIMNITTDAYFLKESYELQESLYYKWIHKNYNQRILIIEFEVNDNEKKTIKDPFENIAAALPYASIVRVNSKDIKFPKSLKRKNRIKISPESFLESI